MGRLTCTETLKDVLITKLKACLDDQHTEGRPVQIRVPSAINNIDFGRCFNVEGRGSALTFLYTPRTRGQVAMKRIPSMRVLLLSVSVLIVAQLSCQQPGSNVNRGAADNAGRASRAT